MTRGMTRGWIHQTRGTILGWIPMTRAAAAIRRQVERIPPEPNRIPANNRTLLEPNRILVNNRTPVEPSRTLASRIPVSRTLANRIPASCSILEEEQEEGQPETFPSTKEIWRKKTSAIKRTHPSPFCRP